MRPNFLIVLLIGLLVLIFGVYEVFERIVLAPRVSMEALHFLHILRGVVSSLLLAGVVAWYLQRRSVPVFPPDLTPDAPVGLSDIEDRARQHARWFVHARWLAAGVILGLILIGGPVTRLVSGTTLLLLLGWWGVLVATNLWFQQSIRRSRSPEGHIMIQAVSDLVILTGLLNASGGIENPLYVAYVFHVIIAAIVLPRRKSFAITVVAASLFLGLVVGEATHVLPHHTNRLFPHTRAVAAGHAVGGGHDVEEADHQAGEPAHAAHDPVFVAGEAGSFLFVLLLAAWLTMMVTDRLRQSEDRLQRTARSAVLERKRLESVVHAARVGMILLDADLSVRWFSPLASEWLHWDASVIGRRCPLYDIAGDQEPGPAVRVLRNGRPAETERAVASADGGLRYFRHVASPVQDGNGRVAQVVELVEDVTARRALETEALHADKMSVLGRMAAGIAHEIGNPLSSMATRLRLMEKSDDRGFLETSLALLQSQIGRIGRIVHGVSEFARMPRQEWATWDVNPTVEEAVSVAELDSRTREIEFQRELARPSPRVRGVRDQVVQVVLNLLLNAAEAMSGRGTIRVVTSTEQGEAIIRVHDSGVGMDENVRARLFEPFFTTKREGTGLGLSISYTLIHAHGGRIEVHSEPDRGSCFTVRLPAAESGAGNLSRGLKE